MTRNLRAVIDRAAHVHPAFGKHLDVTIRTGTHCCYQPDPSAAIRWIVD